MDQSLCETYGWTPQQIDDMTLPEIRVACKSKPTPTLGIIHPLLSAGDLNPKDVGNLYYRMAKAPLEKLIKTSLLPLRQSIGKSRKNIQDLQGRGTLEAAQRSFGLQTSRNRIENLKQGLAATGPIQPVGPGGPANTTQVRQQKLQILITREEQKYQRLLRQDRTERTKIMGQILTQRTYLKSLESAEESITTQAKKREKHLDETTSKIETVTESINKLGHIGIAGLTGVTGAIMGLVRAADPVGFGMFEVELKILSRSIGQIFIPLLREATEAVKGLSAWFDALSPEVRQQVRDWTRLGLKVLAGLAAFALVGKVVSGVMSVFGTLGSAIRGVMLAFQLIGTVGVTAFTGIVSAVRTAYGAIQALWALSVAHPFIAIATAIAAVTAAVLAMNGAFGSVSKQIETATNMIQRLKAEIESLKGGGKAKTENIEETLKKTEGLGKDYWEKLLELARTNPNEAMEYVRKIKRRSEANLSNMEDEPTQRLHKHKIEEALAPKEGRFDLTENAQARKELRKQLRQQRGMSTYEADESINAVETRRFARIKAGLKETGMHDEDAQVKAAEIILRLRERGLKLERELSEEQLKDAGDAAGILQRSLNLNIKAWAEKVLKEGKLPFTPGKDSDKKKDDIGPMMYAQKPELMDIASAWRKAQTSQQGETPEMRDRQDMLRRMARTNELLEKLDENTKHPPGLR